MVSLKNFKRNEETLECDFYPECKEENKCHIVIDKKTENIVSVDVPDGAECYSMHVTGARRQLARYIGGEPFPEVDFRYWA